MRVSISDIKTVGAIADRLHWLFQEISVSGKSYASFLPVLQSKRIVISVIHLHILFRRRAPGRNMPPRNGQHEG